MRLYVGVTDKEYNLDLRSERFRLREDLDREGFFTIEANKRFWGTFETDTPPRQDVKDLMMAISFYEVTARKVSLTKN